MKYAHIKNGVIQGISEAYGDVIVHDAIPLTGDFVAGDLYENGEFKKGTPIRGDIPASTKESRINGIIVTTKAGNTFDGDEVSQTRMTRAILSLGKTGTTSWKLADNTFVEVTAKELTEALTLAMLEQTKILQEFSNAI